MNTTTKEQSPAQEKLAEATSAGEIAIAKPRIPYHHLLQERFGVDQSAWRALLDAIWPSALTIEAVVLALSYCKARNLDPFKKPCHIVPIWSKEKGRMVETIWPGIGELRTTASRTGAYAGFDPCTFGPDKTEKFSGNVGKGERAYHAEATVTFPEWAQITAYRMVAGERLAFPGPRVYWIETFGEVGNSGVPNEMWQTRPRGQIEKCAEAAALRRAFPEEIGEDFTPDEVGRVMKDVTPVEPGLRPTRAEFKEPAQPDLDAQFRQGVKGTVPDTPEEAGEAAEEPSPPATTPPATPSLAAPPEPEAPYTLALVRTRQGYNWGAFHAALIDKLGNAGTATVHDQWVKVNNASLVAMHKADAEAYNRLGAEMTEVRQRHLNVLAAG